MITKARQALVSEIKSLETELNRRTSGKKQAATPKTAREEIIAELKGIEEMVDGMYTDESSCGESFMEDELDIPVDEFEDDEFDEDIEVDEVDEFGDDEFDESSMLDIDDDEEDEIVFASEEDSSGVEEDITQDYLDDVLEEVKNPTSLVTDESILDTAPTGYSASKKAYVQKLRSASARLDNVATYLEKQGRSELAFRIDKIADAVDARIKKETRNV